MMGLVQKYGIQQEGHFWVDDIKKMALLAPKENLVELETALWIILGSEKDIGTDSVRYGLARAREGVIIFVGCVLRPCAHELVYNMWLVFFVFVSDVLC